MVLILTPILWKINKFETVLYKNSLNGWRLLFPQNLIRILTCTTVKWWLICCSVWGGTTSSYRKGECIVYRWRSAVDHIIPLLIVLWVMSTQQQHIDVRFFTTHPGLNCWTLNINRFSHQWEGNEKCNAYRILSSNVWIHMAKLNCFKLIIILICVITAM